MSHPTARQQVLSHIGRAPADLVQAPEGRHSAGVQRRSMDTQALAWHVLCVHGISLRRDQVIDDATFGAIAQSLVATRDVEHRQSSARSLIGHIVDAAEQRLPVTIAGATTIGLAREEWLATVARLAWRDLGLNGLAVIDQVRHAALTLAETHVVTIMPMLIAGAPAQPTTLAHFLGGLIEPLGSSRRRLARAIDAIDRSPLGAGIGVGDVLESNREELARQLGMSGVIGNTLEAIAGIEDTQEVLEAIAAAIRPLERFVNEVRVWIRTDPMSFVLDEGWTTKPEPTHPTLEISQRLDRLSIELATLRGEVDGARARWSNLGYGPLGAAWDDVLAVAGTLDPRLAALGGSCVEFLATGLVVNRAYLGNRAGRGHTTAGDLATFLMTEEQLSPSSAQRIAVLVLAQVRQMSLEVSGITQDMIDSAALITIGREVKVEMETLGRFLAPRRFIERRRVGTGSAAPDLNREWLAGMRAALDADRADHTARVGAAVAAYREISNVVADAASESLEG